MEAPFELLDEGLAARLDPRRPAVVRGYVAANDPAAARAAVDAARSRPGPPAGLRAASHRRGRDARRARGGLGRGVEGALPGPARGRRIVIRPTWREHEATGDDVVISLDPGMAFGTGLHPTTRLCLALDRRRRRSAVWCATRACSTWAAAQASWPSARRCSAPDPCSASTRIRSRSRRRSRTLRSTVWSGRISARQGSVPLGDNDATFDVVLANLVASLLIDLAQAARAVGQAGWSADRERHLRRPRVGGTHGVRVGWPARGRCQSEGDWVALETERAG